MFDFILYKRVDIRVVCYKDISVLINFNDLEKNYLRQLEVQLKIFFFNELEIFANKYKQTLNKFKLQFSITREKFCDKFEETLLLLSKFENLNILDEDRNRSLNNINIF